MIQISGVHHQIGPVPILHDIATTLPEGRLTALIGPNGAGKSTLLRLIGRLEPCQCGRIEVDGLDVAQCPTARLALKLAVLGQQTHIASRLRLRELVAFGRWPHHQGRPGPKDAEAVDAALEAFGLGAISGRFLDEVSGGQRQRAYIAMSLAQATDWLLLDEPLNNLDMAHSRALMVRLRDLVRESGRSIVMVVHEINYAAAWADHIIAMKDGRIVAEGPPAEVLTQEVLGQIYDTDICVTSHEGRPLVLHHA